MAEPLTPLRIIAFPGAPNLPLFTAIEKGCFERAGIEVDLTTTPNSAYQAEQLACGEFEIAATAFDNVVAYRESQGAVSFATPPDFYAFMGATQIALSFVVAPDIKSYDDLRGRTLALDALSTGFAFVLYEMLAQAGLKSDDHEMVPVGATPQGWESVKDGTHAGTLTIEPFTSIAKANGFHELDVSSRIFPSYQGGVFAARKSWLDAHPETLADFVNGYLDGLGWCLEPANREAAAEILLRNMPAIRPQVVGAVLDSLAAPATGLTPAAAILIDGVRAVLDLRSRYGSGEAPLLDADKYFQTDVRDAIVAQRAALA